TMLPVKKTLRPRGKKRSPPPHSSHTRWRLLPPPTTSFHGRTPLPRHHLLPFLAAPPSSSHDLLSRRCPDLTDLPRLQSRAR
uniref:Uncharacterized protein n=1 Tax=Aegilops tauschii subsp. strangulata TaxID=200361 RepID=A0A453NAY3_AEGTS